jgi:truncated hemoglobin YjbI/tellurite resistance-related uncharacterized protein
MSAMEDTSPFTDAALSALVDHFYAKVRRDPMIGPLFNAAVDDWPDHLERLTRFWSAVMRGSGRYKGNPVAAHARHAASIEPAMFDRWLALWKETTEEELPAEAAAAMQAKSARIAESLQLAMKFQRGEPTVAGPARPASRPYRSTPVFDETSLPDGLRREHRTKEGTWGVIRVLSGALRLHVPGTGESQLLTPEHSGVVAPRQTHWVEPVGPMRMQVDFHDAPPSGA